MNLRGLHGTPTAGLVQERFQAIQGTQQGRNQGGRDGQFPGTGTIQQIFRLVGVMGEIGKTGQTGPPFQRMKRAKQGMNPIGIVRVALQGEHILFHLLQYLLHLLEEKLLHLAHVDGRHDYL